MTVASPTWQSCKENLQQTILELHAQKGLSVLTSGMQRPAYALKQEIFIYDFSLFRKIKVQAFQLY